MRSSQRVLPEIFLFTAMVSTIWGQSVYADPPLRTLTPAAIENEHPAPAAEFPAPYSPPEAAPAALPASKWHTKRRSYTHRHNFIPSSRASSLNSREVILLAPAANDWSFEVKKLVETPAIIFASVEGNHHAYPPVSNDTTARNKFEHDNLTPEQISSLETARDAKTYQAAYDVGKNLPSALRAYTAGAVAFKQGDFQHALTYFNEAQVVKDSHLEAAYKVWATFMLGRTHAKSGVYDKARNAFIQTRDMVAKGAPDPLGLASESYGEEARLALDEAGGVLGEDKFKPDQSGRLEHFREAVRLYVMQAQTGSKRGLNSLHILCKEIKNQPSDFTLLTQDEMIRRMFIAYVRGYHSGFWGDTQGYSSSSGGVESREEFITSLLKLFPAEDKDVADQLAAAALEIDNFDLVSHYAQQKQSAFSIWTQARIALHANDIEKAASLYEKAAEQQQRETVHPSLDPRNEAMAHEKAILALARGQFVKSFEELYVLQDVGDFYFVADRILTIDELKQFVKAHEVTEKTAPQAASDSHEYDYRIFYKQFRDKTLKLLTAHRLMRMGSYHEALDYFPEKKSNFGPTEYDFAQRYTEWLDALASANSNIGKAEALYQAAMIMRLHGDDMMGDELLQLEAPDADLSGNPYVSQEERNRLAASRAETTLPHSFRKVATAAAVQAAELLPPKSQAYAAVLCHATGWIEPVDEGRAQELYRLYISKGAIVPWATHYGHHCPAPDFTMAKYQDIRRIYIWVKLVSRRHPIIIITVAISGILMVAGGMLFIHRRKRKLTARVAFGDKQEK
ncbi:MAG TPA: hypothetical protein VFT64_10305 [Rickettsiales bacterium]|nr:hypothetical protein [Rickettsiales bacterium]